jgi:intracellular sulfur oxidation DsrE/DsrF family protein
MKILHILETAYRGTIEEQDDTVIWTVHAMKNSGQAATVLLRGNIVCHAALGQDASGLHIRGTHQSNPVDLAGDLSKLMAAGVDVFVVAEDAADRGLDTAEMVQGVQPVGRAGVAALCDAHEAVWHW